MNIYLIILLSYVAKGRTNNRTIKELIQIEIH